MVRGFEVRTDILEFKPGLLKVAACVEFRLIHVVPALRITTGAEGVDRECPDFWSKLNHADVTCACDSVAAFLSTRGCGVKGEHSAIITIHSANSEARL